MARVTAVASDPSATDPAAADDPGYEQARDELVDVVRRLEAGGTTLEESLALWERGEQLAAICQRWLDGARARLAEASGQPAKHAKGDPNGTDDGGPDAAAPAGVDAADG